MALKHILNIFHSFETSVYWTFELKGLKLLFGFRSWLNRTKPQNGI